MREVQLYQYTASESAYCQIFTCYFPAACIRYLTAACLCQLTIPDGKLLLLQLADLCWSIIVGYSNVLVAFLCCQMVIEFYVGIRVFVIGLNQISFLFSQFIIILIPSLLLLTSCTIEQIYKQTVDLYYLVNIHNFALNESKFP